MAEETLVEIEQKMRRSIEALHKALASVRTGRASAGLIEHLRVEYAGAVMPLNQVAGISVPSANQLVIQPWDRNSIDGIVKAIQTSELGLNPASDGRTIRVNVPPLTEERRQDLTKVARRRVEEGRVSVRNLRREALDELRNDEKNKVISQDEGKRLQGQLQKLTDSFIAETERIGSEKETEILEV